MNMTRTVFGRRVTGGLEGWVEARASMDLKAIVKFFKFILNEKILNGVEQENAMI